MFGYFSTIFGDDVQIGSFVLLLCILGEIAYLVLSKIFKNLEEENRKNQYEKYEEAPIDLKEKLLKGLSHKIKQMRITE